MRIPFCFVVMILVCAPVTLVLAVGTNTTFGVRTLVGEDTIAPTTPILENVAPVSLSQVNIVWGTATDNYSLAGYRLFRDGQQIATTTQTSFSDTGLTASTLYSYTVEAFDSSFNVSSTSLPVATTTLAVPVMPTTTVPAVPHKTTSTMRLLLQSFSLVPTADTAEFAWQTNTNVRYTISWGRTTSYELGSVSTNLYKQGHVTTLENLEPGTRYWYSIQIEDTAGDRQVLKAGDFVTIPTFQSVAPTNVRNIEVDVTGNDVTLRWINPVMAPGSKVRVVRSYFFYPLTITDGALVYEGSGVTALDMAALQERALQYYTIFVIDVAGTVSSGAVVTASKQGAVPAAVPPIPEGVSSTRPAASSSVTVPDSILDESGDAKVLHSESVFVRQGLVVQAFSTGMKLDAGIPYTVYIPVVAVTTNLKSILVSIKDPTDQRMSTTYLLKLNQAGDAYAADIDPPQVAGVAGMTVEVFDFHNASVRRLTAPITFVARQRPGLPFPDNVVYFAEKYGYAALGTFGAVSFWWWFMIARLRRRREDNN